jgi:hypothetical protein
MSTTAEKKKGFNFKSLIFKESEENQQSNNINVDSNKNFSNNYSTPTQNFSQPTSSGSLSGVLVPEIKTDLEKTLNENNFEGEDYLELREAIKGMTGVGLDNNTAMKAAFATLSSRGLSKEKAIQTANQYIEILNGEKQKFYSAIEKRTEEKIITPENEINEISQQNVDLAKQIEEITSKINQNNDVISKKKIEITEAKNMIDRTKINYDFTHGQCVKEIQDDIAKIQTII